jgi:hypothetical protein
MSCTGFWERDRTLASRKDDLLRRIDSDSLLRLARSVSESPVENGVARAELLRIVKESLSVEEIQNRAKMMEVDPDSQVFTEDELVSGGVGQVLLGVSGATGTIGYYLAITSMGGDPYSTIAVWDFISSILFLIFAILTTVSVRKMTGKLGGSRVGTATCVFGLITAIIGLLFYGLAILGVVDISPYIGYNSNILYVVLLVSFSWLVGLTMALLGAFFLMCREHSPNRELWLAGGILYLVAGASELGITSLLIFPVVSLIAPTIGAVCFFTGKPAK